MGRPKGNSEQGKLKKRLRNERYRANIITAERNREKNTLHQQKKREQARLQLHQDPLARLANVVTQQQYLKDATGAERSVGSECMEEQEPIDTGMIVEEAGEILENFMEHLDEEREGGFANDLQLNAYEGFDGGFYDEPNDFGDAFSDVPDVDENGS
jgi:hypothetical protein